ncbi:sigma-70 family RNA polymerase sigma factor [Paracoccus liaowanqingii]|uniref:Sigma-70 family RNA polymerase sigma factor n=1 Tax=Paracoccus liaowanqingii TaxID=2560053 RepID=A0A4Z1CBS8_9RHOB|nr:sigma-70 family RNA polymerase sigma factor [Paracoccus liaowanqingii]TGN59356.1 sigma-70 family RNA polymerase sigma factor [Paracoccus liaowanqingii]
MTRTRDPILDLLTPLRRYAFALTRNRAEADDLVQDALLRGHEQRRQLGAGKAPGPWLRAILRNRFLDRRRHEVAQARREAQFAETTPQVIDAPQDSALRLSQLRRAFLDLPQDQREALELVAVEGLSYGDAGATLGVPAGTVMSRVSRARARLRAFEDGVPEALPEPRPALKLVARSDPGGRP